MAGQKTYVCIQPCTFRAPGTNYDRRYEREQTLTVPADWKGWEIVDPQGKKIVLGVPLKCFRLLKGGQLPRRPSPSEVQLAIDKDPMSAALSGEQVSLSELSGQTLPDE